MSEQLGPILVWMHYEEDDDGHVGLSIGQTDTCREGSPDHSNCGWAALTRLKHRPDDWEGVGDE